MVKWNWRKSRIVFPRENEHLVHALRDFSSELLQFLSTMRPKFFRIFGRIARG